MTKYEYLAQLLEQDIINQKYKRGEKLPSIQTLSKQHHCSKETVIKAYQLLMHQHLIYAKAQSGYYVSLLDRHIVMKVKLLEGSSCHCESNVGVVRGGIGRVKHHLLQNSSLVGIGCVIVDRIPLADGYVDINSYIAVLAARGQKRKTQHQHRQKYRNALHNVPP